MDDLMPQVLDHVVERAALLEGLLENQPGRHLLAEVETALLDRPSLVEELWVHSPEFRSYVVGLLNRIEREIVTLEDSRS